MRRALIVGTQRVSVHRKSTRNFASLMHSTTTLLAREQECVTQTLQDLAARHRLQDRTAASRKRKLVPEHKVDFIEDTAFDRFARVVCEASCINRKELFETWAMALHVQAQFPDVIRFCDIASGHGLLAWALLILADPIAASNQRSAVCVDLRMPESADKLSRAMLAEWPHLEGHLDYVEGRLEGLIPSPLTLMVGVHCCHVLSDRVIDLAIQGSSSLALVPCCHAKKCLNSHQRRRFEEVKDSISLTDFIDQLRIQRLEEEKYSVKEITLPSIYTGKNRLIVAEPAASDRDGATSREVEESKNESENMICTLVGNGNSDRPQKGGHPKDLFAIPLGTSAAARNQVRALAGRVAANHRRNYQEVSLGMAIFHPPDRFLTMQDLEKSLTYKGATIREVNKDGPYMHSSGNYSQSYFVLYPGLSKGEAKGWHREFCLRIPTDSPGARIRQMPR